MLFRRHVAATLLLAGFFLTSSANASSCGSPLVGLNLAGAEFGEAMPGKRGIDYQYPAASEYKSAHDAGLSLVRLPFRWERLQPDVHASPDPNEIAEILAAVENSRKNDLTIILDMHNSALRDAHPFTSDPDLNAAYVNLWVTLARLFRTNDRIIFGLMNEPIKVDAITWLRLQQSTIDAVRATGFRGPLLISGVDYSGVHSWFKKRDGVSNADALQQLHDPQNNILIELHQYFDSDSSGTSAMCRPDFSVAAVFNPVTAWLHEHGLKGLLAEYGGAPNGACIYDIDETLKYLKGHPDTWFGSTYWAGGGHWGSGYPYAIDFRRGIGLEQLNIITKYSCY